MINSVGVGGAARHIYYIYIYMYIHMYLLGAWLNKAVG